MSNSSTTSPSNTTSVPWVPFMNPVNQVKLGMAAALLVSVFIVTLIPFIVIRHLSKKWGIESVNKTRENSKAYRRFTTWLSRINCFAGGVFLSTGFMDIFPEMLESIEEAKIKNKMTSVFPLGPFLTLIGFFMILIIEELVTFIKNRFYGSKVSPTKVVINDEFIMPTESNAWPSSAVNENTFDFDKESRDSNQVLKKVSVDRELHDHSIDHAHHDHHDHDLNAEALSRGTLSVTILMIAISIHSIFEGLALGLQKETSAATRLFLALCLHKYIIATTISLQLSKSSLGIKMACLCSGIFSFATPFGVVLGFWVNYLEENGNTSFSMVAGVLQGIACGTFFYIVFFEILPEEFGKKQDKILKIVAVILGFALVSLFMLFIHE
uniref:Slc39a-13 n=1 Tax=Schmidtea mediterranea TaxID=79327 RepID=A0A0H3YKI3_SCHMD|nr:slc39a-13 [Schmidtea mediterranea]